MPTDWYPSSSKCTPAQATDFQPFGTHGRHGGRFSTVVVARQHLILLSGMVPMHPVRTQSALAPFSAVAPTSPSGTVRTILERVVWRRGPSGPVRQLEICPSFPIHCGVHGIN